MVGSARAMVAAVIAMAVVGPVLARPTIREPAAGTTPFGTVTIVVVPEPGSTWDRLEIRVDDVPVATRTEPPWEARFDFGDSGAARRIDAVAYRAGDVLGSATRRTPALVIHDAVDLDLQQLYVTVTDRRGERVKGLGQAPFSVVDQGRRQELVTFAHGDVPFAANLLVDASASMAGRPQAAALAGARAFLAAMGEHDEARITLYADRPRAVTAWARTADELLPALDEVTPRGGSAVLDHLYHALLALERRQGRRVVVLLSDGSDLHSAVDVDDLERLARRTRAIVYWVKLASDDQKRVLSAWRDADAVDRTRTRLRRIVRLTGGRVDTVASLDDVAHRFADIVAELREQYALGYYPNPRLGDGTWREVEVSIDRPGLAIRTREGYVDR